MIIYSYLLFILFFAFDFADSSSIRSKNLKNDLVSTAGSKSSDLPSLKDGNAMKIISNEPFIIQLAMPNYSDKRKKGEDGEKGKKKKRPLKHRLPKLKALRKRLRLRRDISSSGLKTFFGSDEKKLESSEGSISGEKIPRPENQDHETWEDGIRANNRNRRKVYDALDEALNMRSDDKQYEEDSLESDGSEEYDEKNDGDSVDWLKNQETIKKKIHPRFKQLTSGAVEKKNSETLKGDEKDLTVDWERMNRKINHINKILNESDDEIRVRRKTDEDRTANKIAKMFLTLTAMNDYHGKSRRPKCRAEYEDEIEHYWPDKEKVAVAKRNPSSNEERYKVKKWIEHMKNKRSNRFCPCSQSHYNGDDEKFPFEKSIVGDYRMEDSDRSSEEITQETYGRGSRYYFPRHNYYPRGRSGRDYYGRCRYPKVNSNLDETLKALRSRGRRKLELPLEDLEVYRNRAKKILQNAEDILDKIKEEEEKRNPQPDYLTSYLKELKSRVQSDSRNNENNEFIQLLQKALGWGSPQRDNENDEDRGTYIDNLMSYFTDPFEKARELTEESARQLATYILRNFSNTKDNNDKNKKYTKQEAEEFRKSQIIENLKKENETEINNSSQVLNILNGYKKQTMKSALENSGDETTEKENIQKTQLNKIMSDLLKEEKGQEKQIPERVEEQERNEGPSVTDKVPEIVTEDNLRDKHADAKETDFEPKSAQAYDEVKEDKNIMTSSKENEGYLGGSEKKIKDDEETKQETSVQSGLATEAELDKPELNVEQDNNFEGEEENVQNIINVPERKREETNKESEENSDGEPYKEILKASNQEQKETRDGGESGSHNPVKKEDENLQQMTNEQKIADEETNGQDVAKEPGTVQKMMDEEKESVEMEAKEIADTNEEPEGETVQKIMGEEGDVETKGEDAEKKQETVQKTMNEEKKSVEMEEQEITGMNEEPKDETVQKMMSENEDVETKGKDAEKEPETVQKMMDEEKESLELEGKQSPDAKDQPEDETVQKMIGEDEDVETKSRESEKEPETVQKMIDEKKESAEMEGKEGADTKEQPEDETVEKMMDAKKDGAEMEGKESAETKEQPDDETVQKMKGEDEDVETKDQESEKEPETVQKMIDEKKESAEMEGKEGADTKEQPEDETVEKMMNAKKDGAEIEGKESAETKEQPEDETVQKMMEEKKESAEMEGKEIAETKEQPDDETVQKMKGEDEDVETRSQESEKEPETVQKMIDEKKESAEMEGKEGADTKEQPDDETVQKMKGEDEDVETRSQESEKEPETVQKMIDEKKESEKTEEKENPNVKDYSEDDTAQKIIGEEADADPKDREPEKEPETVQKMMDKEKGSVETEDKKISDMKEELKDETVQKLLDEVKESAGTEQEKIDSAENETYKQKEKNDPEVQNLQRMKDEQPTKELETSKQNKESVEDEKVEKNSDEESEENVGVVKSQTKENDIIEGSLEGQTSETEARPKEQGAIDENSDVVMMENQPDDKMDENLKKTENGDENENEKVETTKLEKNLSESDASDEKVANSENDSNVKSDEEDVQMMNEDKAESKQSKTSKEYADPEKGEELQKTINENSEEKVQKKMDEGGNEETSTEGDANVSNESNEKSESEKVQSMQNEDETKKNADPSEDDQEEKKYDDSENDVLASHHLRSDDEKTEEDVAKDESEEGLVKDSKKDSPSSTEDETKSQEKQDEDERLEKAFEKDSSSTEDKSASAEKKGEGGEVEKGSKDSSKSTESGEAKDESVELKLVNSKNPLTGTSESKEESAETDGRPEENSKGMEKDGSSTENVTDRKPETFDQVVKSTGDSKPDSSEQNEGKDEGLEWHENVEYPKSDYSNDWLSVNSPDGIKTDDREHLKSENPIVEDVKSAESAEPMESKTLRESIEKNGQDDARVTKPKGDVSKPEANGTETLPEGEDRESDGVQAKAVNPIVESDNRILDSDDATSKEDVSGVATGRKNADRPWARHPYEDETYRYYDDPLFAGNPPNDYGVLDASEVIYPPLRETSSGKGVKDKVIDLDVPTAIRKIMNDLSGETERDEIGSIRNLDPTKIDRYIGKIDQVENENQKHEADCRKECACADEMDSRSRTSGRYEIVKDFLHWVKDLRMNRVLSDD